MTSRTPKQAQVKEIEKVFLNNKEAQKYMGVSESTMKNFRLSGMLRYYKIGSIIWYEKKDIDQLIKRNKV